MIVTAGLWAGVCAEIFVNSLLIEEKRKKEAKDMGRLYLWMVTVFSGGSFLFLLGEDFWGNILIFIAARPNEVRLTMSFAVWIFGSIALVRLLSLIKEKLETR